MFLSILTASLDRGKYLKKLYKSLLSQKFKKFEWIIGDDASTDETEKIVKKFINEKKIKIIYFKASLHIGKIVLDNALLSKAKGEFIIHCDSDDFFRKKSLSFFFSTYHKNRNLFKKDLVGIISQNLSTTGASQTYNKNYLPIENKIYTWEDARKFIKGDGTIFVKRKIFKNKKFPEVDFISNESILLENLYKGKKFILSKKVTKIMDRSANLSVSFGNKLRYCRGSMFSIIHSLSLQKYNDLTFFKKLKLNINYSRYSIHADVNFSKAKKNWVISRNNKIYFIYYIAAQLICSIDRFRNKVVKTHIEFDLNKKKYKIIEIYNYRKNYKAIDKL